MSLNWNMQEVPEGVRTVTALVDEPMSGIKAGDKIMAPVSNALIWATMAVGIGVINDETADEFYARLNLLTKLDLYGSITLWKGDVETGEWETRAITREEVEAHKGLSTNVFPMETRASFVKRWVTTAPLFPNPEPKRKR